MSTLSGPQVAEQAPEGWAQLAAGLQTRVRTGDFATGLAVLKAIAAAAEEMDHHPDLDLRYTHLDVRLLSHDVGGITDRDIRLARRVSTIAAEAGVTLDSAAVAALELGLDTPAAAAVLPFWAAVLALEPPRAGEGNDLHDPAGHLPTVWFQDSDDTEPRQRWHPDVWIDPAVVQPRIDAALAVGGTLVSDAHAPSFWVLADPEGNRVCLCTWQERG